MNATTTQLPTDIATPAPPYDVIIVGGGAAGLSAAVTLGRARRRVAVIDAGEPRNAPAQGVHGFLTRDGISPHDLIAAGRAEARGYGVDVIDGRVIAATQRNPGFEVTVATSAAEPSVPLITRRMIIATGVIDELPDVPGLFEQWGRGVVHCPYCHGWEIRDRAIGVLASGPMYMHQATLFRQWSGTVTLFLHDQPEPTDEELRVLAARKVAVVRGRVAGTIVENGVLVGVRLAGGETHGIDALAVATTLRVRGEGLEGLGVELADMPKGMGCQFATDEWGRTSVPGVWAVGNAADGSAQVVVAAASGMRAGAAVNADLVEADIALELAAPADGSVAQIVG